jgi:hypothetical protein
MVLKNSLLKSNLLSSLLDQISSRIICRWQLASSKLDRYYANTIIKFITRKRSTHYLQFQLKMG